MFYNSHKSYRLVLLVITCEYKQKKNQSTIPMNFLQGTSLYVLECMHYSANAYTWIVMQRLISYHLEPRSITSHPHPRFSIHTCKYVLYTSGPLEGKLGGGLREYTRNSADELQMPVCSSHLKEMFHLHIQLANTIDRPVYRKVFLQSLSARPCK